MNIHNDKIHFHRVNQIKKEIDKKCGQPVVNSLQRRTVVEYKWMMAASTPSMYEGRRRRRRRQQWRSDEVL